MEQNPAFLPAQINTKASLLWRRKACPLWRMSGSLWLRGFDLLICLGMLESWIPSEIPSDSALGGSSSLPEWAGLGAEGILEQTQGPGDLSCMGKSNHAAAALGCYFSTRGWLWEDFFLLWAELELSQWTFHPATHNKPSDCCTQWLVWKCLFGTKGVTTFHIYIFHIHVFVMSDGPAESQSSKNCAGKTSSVNFRNSAFILR